LIGAVPHLILRHFPRCKSIINQFGSRLFKIFFKTYTEKVEFTFMNGLGNVVNVTQKSGCRGDGGLASYAIDVPGGIYDIVVIRPLAATEPGGTSSASALLVSEVGACLSAATSCVTSLTSETNFCT